MDIRPPLDVVEIDPATRIALRIAPSGLCAGALTLLAVGAHILDKEGSVLCEHGGPIEDCPERWSR